MGMKHYKALIESKEYKALFELEAYYGSTYLSKIDPKQSALNVQHVRELRAEMENEARRKDEEETKRKIKEEETRILAELGL